MIFVFFLNLHIIIGWKRNTCRTVFFFCHSFASHTDKILYRHQYEFNLPPEIISCISLKNVSECCQEMCYLLSDSLRSNHNPFTKLYKGFSKVWGRMAFIHRYMPACCDGPISMYICYVCIYKCVYSTKPFYSYLAKKLYVVIVRWTYDRIKQKVNK